MATENLTVLIPHRADVPISTLDDDLHRAVRKQIFERFGDHRTYNLVSTERADVEFDGEVAFVAHRFIFSVEV